MASKEEVAQLKKVVQELRKGQLDILIRLETLEDQVAALEGGEGTPGKPKEPEPILTCVQCSADYKESENAEGSCKYHAGQLKGVGHNFKYSCCNKGGRNYDSARDLPGCTKGKHRSKHHTEYFYAGYYFHMNDLSKKAKQIWLTMNVQDHVTEHTEWAEVGLSDEDKVFILVGSIRNACGAYAEFSSEELKQCKEASFTALQKSDSAGWAIRAEIQATGSVANAITVSIKPASSSTPLVKRVKLDFDDDTPRPGEVECLSDPAPSQPSAPYTIPEPTYEGPVLDPGEDYSKDRKNDYETETINDCPLKVQQHAHTEVSSNTSKNADGKWNNLFSATLKVTNTCQENLAITDVYGEYMNEAGEWVKCDNQWIGTKGWMGFYNWLGIDATNFSLDPASTGTVIARLAIAFSDKPPPSSYEGCRAHRSLPQPLHLRVTLVDQQDRTASLRFEQGNTPLDLATRELREKNWKRVQFHIFADDVESCKRSDAALYYDGSGVLLYRPAPCDNSSQYYYICSSIANAAYKAKKAGEKEYELTNMKKESQGSTVQAFVVVDPEAGVGYAIKVVITTPTSGATGYYLLPYDDVSLASMTVEPQQVPLKSEFSVNWTVPRASKNDRIEIYPRHGKSYVGRAATNKERTTTGSAKMKAPDAPGQYEVRYYPGWLKSNTTGYRHDGYWATTTFTVTQA